MTQGLESVGEPTGFGEETDVQVDANVPLIDREIAWLGFNGRVLQEAADPNVPLFERVRFLAIYSSNLDEFFRVRVASIRSLLRLGKKSRKKLHFDPREVLKEIRRTVNVQQEEFGRVYREDILPRLEREGIVIKRADFGTELPAEQQAFVESWFEEHVRPILSATFLHDGAVGPFLRNRRLYLVVQLSPRLARTPWGEEETGEDKVSPMSLGIVEIPTAELSRFVEIPSPEGEHHLLLLDDVLRLSLGRIFPGFDPVDAWSVKLSRDADLHIGDEFSGDLLKKIRKSLRKRETGMPSRFLYDRNMPEAVLKVLRKAFDLRKMDLVAGGRQHNFSDYFSFPFPEKPEHVHRPLPPLPHANLHEKESLFRAIAEKDRMLHFPYQSWEYVLRFMGEAVSDDAVESIAVTLYRLADDSRVARALMDAARAGKQVTAFVEVKARFDEESNLYWAGQMEAAGVNVHYSFPGLKVHSKLCLVRRREEGTLRRYAYLATGNFNEKTARLYCDHGLFTAHPEITEEVDRVFGFLTGRTPAPEFSHLLVAPLTLRSRLEELVCNEIAAAERGEPAAITLKINALEDPDMIALLCRAGNAGVQVRLIVRGIFCLMPGIPERSENIHAVSIVGRFLEHARIYLFHNGGDERMYVASADWMKRNLSRRVEVAFPIYDERLQSELRTLLDLQWNDNCKARILDPAITNQRRSRPDSREEQILAQEDFYAWIERQQRND